MKTIKLDLLIIGGGVAGLWCLNRVRAAGYSSILFESAALGGGQTICSQGILHGGAKYSLTGSLSQATQSIAEMPKRWFDCLNGEGEIDLRQTQMLSDTHYLWSINKLSSKVTAFFASKAMKNKAQKLKTDQFPAAFQSPEFKGNLYALNERVVDVPSLIKNLARHQQESIFQFDLLKQGRFIQDDNGQVSAIELPELNCRLEPTRILFTCGEAYNDFKDILGLNQIQMQKRPLHMVVVRHEQGPEVYAHAIGAASKPLLTITSHRHSSGDQVWHIGGLIAEDGVAKNQDDLIQEAKQKLQDYLPWITLKNPQWSSYRINRAEPEMQGIRPDTSFLKQQFNCLIAWPTKLALAPQLSDRVLDVLSEIERHDHPDLDALRSLSTPTVAPAIWEIA